MGLVLLLALHVPSRVGSYYRRSSTRWMSNTTAARACRLLWRILEVEEHNGGRVVVREIRGGWCMCVQRSRE